MGEILGFGFQARIGERTILELLRERMDGVDRVVRRPRLKQRLGLKGFACCGASWAPGPTVMDEEELDEVSSPLTNISPAQNLIQNGPDPPCETQSPVPAARMNLATALAAERQLRLSLGSDAGVEFPIPKGSPARVSLMRLMEETNGWDGEMRLKEEAGLGGRGQDWVCCVCMGRKKGSAFIACGHTFCRVCSREMWMNRGSCPLCNRPILEILDIY